MAAFTIFGHRRLRHRQDPGGSSPFTGLLPRIRTLRDGGVWHALTSFGAVNARCARVAEARERIHDLPPPYTPVEQPNKARRTLRRWFVMVLIFMVIALGIIGAGAVAEYKRMERISRQGFQINYFLPAVPTFLAESVALANAVGALADAGLDITVWIPLRVDEARRSTAPDGRRDVFFERVTATIGSITFRRADSTNALRTVYMYLSGDQLQCSVR